jgi:hypothetical protein
MDVYKLLLKNAKAVKVNDRHYDPMRYFDQVKAPKLNWPNLNPPHNFGYAKISSLGKDGMDRVWRMRVLVVGTRALGGTFLFDKH